ncbi:helix-turn-helix transcriptional regulator [Cognatilysobacter lacus]|uniref:MarR family transcriptional regulator n=1 Tax=Cognatilysobacter lacus TaxID=1643323 RepID=A0A5D8Z9L5_9GAMM|nr:MarR family transcriptional regulator [Lysobacter lacus]TZF91588.1 MarR family transcriptional regulator [Lysobacter lacus]
MSTAQPGGTRQALLRHLLRGGPQGADVESLCGALRISHNAVRQHLTAALAAGLVEHAPARATGGRPQSRYRLTVAGQERFPRNYGLIAGALLEAVSDRLGSNATKDLLTDLGGALGRADPIDPARPDAEIADALADRLQRAGYEAVPTLRGGQAQVEAFNCVFHAIARENADVCRFDIAFLEAASGRRIQHAECIVRGGHVCRFLIGHSPPPQR